MYYLLHLILQQISNSTIPFIPSYYGLLVGYVKAHGYIAIFILMSLEGSSLPVPSELVLPLAGVLAAKGYLTFYFAFLAGFAGSVVGLTVDYFIGYYIGRERLHKHLHLFHIKEETLNTFEQWFDRNAFPALFISRLIPVVRTAMSFPAGFARVDMHKFYTYSMLGTFIWDIVLVGFGYFLLSGSSAVIIMTSSGIFILILYLLYTTTLKRIRSSNRNEKRRKEKRTR